MTRKSALGSSTTVGVQSLRTAAPRHVTANGQQQVFVVTAGQQRENRKGDALIAACQASRHREIEIEPTRVRLPVRDIVL